MTSNNDEAPSRAPRDDSKLAHKLTIEREPGNPLEIDTRKRTFLVLTSNGHWGRSNLSMSWAAWNAFAAGACISDPGLAVTILGDNDAFIAGLDDLNYATNALNCGSVKVSSVGALLEHVDEVSAWLKKEHHDAESRSLNPLRLQRGWPTYGNA